MKPHDRARCVFCGAYGKLTGEHVFGDWLSKIGLSDARSAHGVGPLNRSLRDIGTTPPFRRKVRDVCGSCNHGWMSSLEAAAKRVLTPFILGESGSIATDDAAAVAAWTHKTVLVAMLMLSKESRARGGGLSPAEYDAVYTARGAARPAPATQFWIGRYGGEQRVALAWATPVVVQVDGLPEPELPHAYVMNVIVGQLLLQGVRFTSPALEVKLEAGECFSQLWPAEGDLVWPPGEAVDDRAFVAVSLGRNLSVQHPGLTLRAWRPATDLPASEPDGEVVRLPTPCGEHFVCYPRVLVAEAARGVFYAFVTHCECGKAYLVQTEGDGAHFKAEAMGEAVGSLGKRYESLAGDELMLSDACGTFACKRLASNSPSAGR